jgi:hypothetical protein
VWNDGEGSRVSDLLQADRFVIRIEGRRAAIFGSRLFFFQVEIKLLRVMVWIKWTVLILGTLWAIGTNMTLRDHYKRSQTPMITVNTFALIQTLSVVVIIAFHRSPLHLLWLFPLSYLAGFFTLRSKVLVFLPWLYGYLMLFTLPSTWRRMVA